MYAITDQEFSILVVDNITIADILRSMGISPRGGNYNTIKRRISRLNLDTSHFRMPPPKKCTKVERTLEEFFAKNIRHGGGKLLRRLLKEGIKKYECEYCGRIEWEGHPIPLEVHHIDGDNTDNLIENLKVLCPNCHCFTKNYRGKKNKRERLPRLCSCGTKISRRSVKCRKCNNSSMLRSKIKPSKEELLLSLGERPWGIWMKLAKKYEVSDNSVRKWAKSYGLL